MSFFSLPEKINALPPNLSDPINEMMYEREHSGVHTTPDETAHVIEALFNHVGRLWLAELLNLSFTAPEHIAKAQSSGLLSWLFDLILSTKKALLMGKWIYVSRTIQTFFQTHDIQPITKGLLKVDYGTHADKNHPVTRLNAFRNRFAHGAYEAEVSEINVHFELLGSIFEAIEGLQSPIMAHCEGQWYECRNGYTEIEPPTEAIDDVYLDSDNEQKLRLSPFFILSKTESELAFTLSGIEYLTADEIFISDILNAWMLRYREEREGKLDCTDEIEALATYDLDSAVSADIEDLLKKETGGLCIVQAHPGTGISGLIHAFHNGKFETNGFDKEILWVCKPNNLRQSGYTFLQHIFRNIEALLEIPSGRFGSNRNTLFQDLDSALDLLLTHNKKVLIAIHALENGNIEYRSEGITLIDVYNALSHPALWVIADSQILTVGDTVYYDSMLQFPNTIQNESEISVALRQVSEDQLAIAILRSLAQSEDALSLFALCDILDEQDLDVFEPQVERKLWQLRSLLSTSQQTIDKEYVRTWSLFHSNLQSLMERQ